MSKDQPFVFGYRPACSSCQHQDRHGVLLGHPSPCRKVTWVGTTHVQPRWQNGDCSDFERMGQTVEAGT